MVASNVSEAESVYDRERQLKALDETKAGVKGLADAGVEKLPGIFIHEQHRLNKYTVLESDSSIPVIDLADIDESSSARRAVIEKVKYACENWGFFQVVNHGIPVSVLDKMIGDIRAFHEGDLEMKKEFYNREFLNKNVVYNTNFDLYQVSSSTNWRDTLNVVLAPRGPKPDDLPAVCRDVLLDYADRLMNSLGPTLFELVSEALGLKPNHLKDMGCIEGFLLEGHYFPACPEPELTLGTSDHSDSGFLTVLLQDQVGGLQVLHDNKWINVKPIHGALIINVGDMLQLISNGKLLSVIHRVRANNVGPRTSVASFFRTHLPPENSARVYGPIEELTSKENPPIYRETTIKDLVEHYYGKGHNGISALEFLRIN
ncbi:1-aminocyclopropane-1-carboxylate oxidase homolog 12-like [Ziziphus jujuba]|uniref:1-aminocyclopropane-1-carboxylate oxidase homolog 12-like n=1 Tax=Ziziphus jujuba TaxID=326968 RepID=A0A6P4AP28_ZIZJJ|nr:1-aminocyclopropane-1-carboxylate oxidase homolog 12-like [Ziziphus jujuba]